MAEMLIDPTYECKPYRDFSLAYMGNPPPDQDSQQPATTLQTGTDSLARSRTKLSGQVLQVRDIVRPPLIISGITAIGSCLPVNQLTQDL